MESSVDDFVAHLLNRLRQVQENLGMDTTVPNDPSTRFAEAVDSMGLVELVSVLAEDCDVSPEDIEQSVAWKFGTIAEVARSLHAARLSLTRSERRGARREEKESEPLERHFPLPSLQTSRPSGAIGWLVSATARLPERVQTADQINATLRRPPGWLERHAGIQQRRVWADQDALTAAVDAAREGLDRSGLAASQLGGLLVTSEAPPMPVGLAAAIHNRLGLTQEALALEVGGACTGFLAALWMASKMLPAAPVVLIISIESHSSYLRLEPGPAGEAAALFGDAAAACIVSDRPIGSEAIPVGEIHLRTDGSAGGLLRVERSESGAFELRMQGIALAGQAVRVMAQSVRDIADRQGLKVADLAAVVAHGGNGRLPDLLARQLDLPRERIWSQTPTTGNLGSASLPVAWAFHHPVPQGPVIWTAVGAGLTWGAALTGETIPKV